MIKQWLGCAPNNFLKGRKSLRPEAIVIHAYSNLDEAETLFADPGSAQSCHYTVDGDGHAYQFVDELDTAFHAGLVINPSWRFLHSAVNPNLYTLGVAGLAGTGIQWPEGLYDTLAELLRELCVQWNIPVDADHIVLHAEIRASKDCTGKGFDRNKLLARLGEALPVQAVARARQDTSFVHLISNANLRSRAPNTRELIVRTLLKGSDIEVVDSTDRGERIQGNACWYETRDGFLWSGNTDKPHPVQVAVSTTKASPPVAAHSPPGAVESGIPMLDALLKDRGAPAINSGTRDHTAIGAIQDLLSGHGVVGMPNCLSPLYGRFGTKISSAIQSFQGQHDLPPTGVVDSATLLQLIAIPASEPRASLGYLTLVLHKGFTGLLKVVSIVSQMEGAGKFGALNLNIDGAGLSYGIIQWAQRPGRLLELLRAYSAADQALYVEIFGEGDAVLADALLALLGRSNGGVDPKKGITIDARFDLIKSPWTERFKQATLQLKFQIAQVDAAVQAFGKSYQVILGYSSGIESERGVAFMLDVANQFGDGGLKRIYNKVHRSGMGEMEILEAIADETVEHMPDKFKHGVRARRDDFLTTALLSDDNKSFRVDNS